MAVLKETRDLLLFVAHAILLALTMRHHYILLTYLISTTYAFQFPFSIPKLFSSHPTVVPNAEQVLVPTTPRIAIIGAGAGGSSAAFWISKAVERFGVDVEIDVYDDKDYIGGRELGIFSSLCRGLFQPMQEARSYTRMTIHLFPNLNLARPFL